jgi:hypothetical protein
LSIWLSLPGQPIRNRAIFIPWMASAAPGNTRRRQAADIYCNLRTSVLPGKKLIMTYSTVAYTIRVHLQFCPGGHHISPLQPSNDRFGDFLGTRCKKDQRLQGEWMYTDLTWL